MTPPRPKKATETPDVVEVPEEQFEHLVHDEGWVEEPVDGSETPPPSEEPEDAPDAQEEANDELAEKSAEVAAEAFDNANELETPEPEEEEEPELSDEEQEALDKSNEAAAEALEAETEATKDLEDEEVEEPELSEQEQAEADHVVEVSEDAFDKSNEQTEYAKKVGEKAQEREDRFQENREAIDDDGALDHTAVARAKMLHESTKDGRLGLSAVSTAKVEQQEPIGGSYKPEDSVWKKFRDPALVMEQAETQLEAEKA